MDNGLIFPYPRAAVQAETPDAKRLVLASFRGCRGMARTEGAVGEPLG